MTTVIKTLEWDNFFSYGKGNKLDFTTNNVTQLVGLNGVGKTSIPLILQEILFGKNVKKTPKAKLINRYIDEKDLWGKLTFSSDELEYVLELTRKSNKVNLKLMAGDEDISSHTTLGTLKTVEDLLGYGFDVFCQLVYQSSKASLQFLTSTDTQRKRFLISLFDLDHYLDKQDKFKKVITQLEREVAGIEGKYSVYETWIKDHENVQEVTDSLVDVPESPRIEQDLLTDAKAQLQNIASENTRINKNNAYKGQLKSINVDLLHEIPSDTSQLQTVISEKISTSTLISEKEKFVRNIEGKSDTCPTCKQRIDISDSVKLADKYRTELQDLKIKFESMEATASDLQTREAHNKVIKKTIADFEELTNLVDDTLPSEISIASEIEEQMHDLSARILDVENSIKVANRKNEEIQKKKALAQAVLDQRQEYTDKLNESLNLLVGASDKLANLQILRDAFGTNGLLSYKLEYLTKDLENIINEYLQDLSKGEFQLNFILSGDKLNIDIFHDGKTVSISELSEGELGKVNVSTVLAIRKLMQDLSNTKINVLFLDEIMGVLDDFGREELIHILLKEKNLNTFLVTHAYRHPLVPIINVVKEEKISRIEHG